MSDDIADNTAENAADNTADSPPSNTELSADDVRHIAALARIGMTDEDVERFRTELSSILGHFDVLARIDTEGVEPTNNGADLLNVMVADESRPSLPSERVLANATTREDDLFRVKAVLG